MRWEKSPSFLMSWPIKNDTKMVFIEYFKNQKKLIESRKKPFY